MILKWWKLHIAYQWPSMYLGNARLVRQRYKIITNYCFDYQRKLFSAPFSLKWSKHEMCWLQERLNIICEFTRKTANHKTSRTLTIFDNKLCIIILNSFSWYCSNYFVNLNHSNSYESERIIILSAANLVSLRMYNFVLRYLTIIEWGSEYEIERFQPRCRSVNGVRPRQNLLE